MKCKICKKETNCLIPFPVHNKTMHICLTCFKEQTVTRKEMLKAKKETEKISKSFIGKILRLKPYCEYVEKTKIQFGVEKAKKIFMLQFTPYFKKQSKRQGEK